MGWEFYLTPPTRQNSGQRSPEKGKQAFVVYPFSTVSLLWHHALSELVDYATFSTVVWGKKFLDAS